MVAIEVYDCERRARTVTAIKYVRELKGLGLLEAKQLIDEVYFGGRTITLSFASAVEAGLFADQMGSLGFSCRFVDAQELPLAVSGNPLL